MTNLTARRGDNETYTFTVSDEDDELVDLSSADVRFTAKASSRDLDADALIVKTTGDGIVGDAEGIATVSLVPADTADLVQTHLLWDLQVTAGGKTNTVAGGLLRVSRDVSQTTP